MIRVLFRSAGRGRVVITIDGPAGAGKSTVARAVAQRLGFRFLDTGAMYRACTWAALRASIRMDDPDAVVALVRRLCLEIDDDGATQRVRVDGQDVTAEIRNEGLARHIYHVADSPAARAELGRLQQEYAEGRDVVTEGRDQGTEVFPGAAHKFFLDASLEERARRRSMELAGRGYAPDPGRMREDLAARDARDRARPVGALKPAPGAVVIDTTGLTVEQVVEAIVRRVRGDPETSGGSR
jgi:cytidylate kinase